MFLIILCFFIINKVKKDIILVKNLIKIQKFFIPNLILINY